MNFDKEYKSRRKFCFFFSSVGSGGLRVQGRVQLICGHVDIDRMIIQIKDFWGGGVVKWGQGRLQGKQRGGQGIRSNNSHK